MRENIVKTKSFAFAVKIVQLYRSLSGEQKEYVLSKQLLRSGTAVGAMVREAEHAESKADFKHKLAIAQKEINESIYWLELLKASDYLEGTRHDTLRNDAIELIRIITAIIKRVKQQEN